jgi:oligopeptide/dipeptide ABC transporter ATP-binding protein
MSSTRLLEVKGLSTVYQTGRGTVRAVQDVSFGVAKGEVLGIVGESGCGKTTVAMSLLRLIKPPGQIVAGSVHFEGENLFARKRATMREIRGSRIAMVPQAAMHALDPVRTASTSVAEVIRAHRDVSRKEARSSATRLLESVGIGADRGGSYPHELSGGMRQRVVIAMALANDPSLIVADEPVTGLDVIVQAQVLKLLSDLRRSRGLAMMFISHDIRAVSKISDRIMVMYGGRVVEEGPAPEVVSAPKHPYTQGLLAAIPTMDGPRGEVRSIPGEVVTATGDVAGCPFQPRCPSAMDVCATENPAPRQVGEAHDAACHLYEPVTGPEGRSNKQSLGRPPEGSVDQ